MNIDFMLTETWLQGMLGGATLGAGRLLINFVRLNHARTETKYVRFFLAHIIAGIFFSILGGAFAWGMEGRAGNFTAGISAMLLLSLLAGKLMPEFTEAEEEHRVQ
ncbi:hypothetical protein [Arthrobacter globiformis]|uniref:hypothetical protein n=1 Tax=Arthrobacter globiformis TaxID=1665 RepID=UPI00278DFAED|nr:hypothetical protein [Arthrobacter globiformis]MDQ0618253.1 hypothetical protein [Arthrobacter globiformis]